MLENLHRMLSGEGEGNGSWTSMEKTLCLVTYRTSGKLLNPSGPWSPHLKTEVIFPDHLAVGLSGHFML